MKHDWLVENEEAKKALHDLYFETGSLPHQQPKVKAKEPEKPAPQVSLPAPLASLAKEAAPLEAPAAPGTSRPSWIKRFALMASALVLAFIAYRAWPTVETSSARVTPKHSQSPFIKTSLQKLQDATAQKSPVAAAPASGTLEVGPSIIMVGYEPGQSTIQSITVENRTPLMLTFAIDAADLISQGERTVLVPAGDSTDSVAASAVFSQRFVQVEPMQVQSIQVTLTFPAVTTVHGVLVRLRSTDNLPLGDSQSATTSFGTLIAFVRSQDGTASNSSSPSAMQNATRHFTLAQWSVENSGTVTTAGGQGTPAGSSSGKEAKVAGIRQ